MPPHQLPTVFAAALAATYASVAVVVYFFARHVIRLTTQDSASNTRGPSNIGMFSIRPFISTRTTKQSAQDIAKVNASKVTDATLCLDYDITCPGADESRGSHDLMTMTMVKGSAPTCSTTNTSSDQDVKSLQQTLGNLQDFLWNCRREATGTTAAAAAASTNTNIAATQSIRHLASMGTFPSTISSTSIRGHQDKPLAELFTDTTVLFADIEGTIDQALSRFLIWLTYRFFFPDLQDSQLGARPVNLLRYSIGHVIMLCLVHAMAGKSHATIVLRILPSQVFVLLETRELHMGGMIPAADRHIPDLRTIFLSSSSVYHAFDSIAVRRKVFKASCSSSRRRPRPFVNPSHLSSQCLPLLT